MRSSMQKPIPPAIREKLAQDPFMTHCLIAYEGNCEGRVQWHHNLIYGGKRMNDWWSILPVCEKHHRKESKYKDTLNLVMCDRAPFDELLKYSKVINYAAIKSKTNISK